MPRSTLLFTVGGVLVGSIVAIAVNYSLSRRRNDAAMDTSLWGKLRSLLYDGAIVPFTSKWYQKVLYSIPQGSRILDVGIGTGAALVANADILNEKHMTVVGVDYDAAYIRKCQDLITLHGLSDYISVTCCSFYDYYQEEERFDHVYFSGSFMILPDAVEALRHALGLLKDKTNGRLYFTQTFELERNVLLEKIKPALTYITSIDFGRVTYVEDFETVLQEAGVVVMSSTRMDDGKASRGRESRLVVARSCLTNE